MIINLPRRSKPRRRRKVTVVVPLQLTGVVFVSDLGTEIEVLLGVNTTSAAPLLDTIAANPAKWTARNSGNLFTGVSVSKDHYDRLMVTMTQTGTEAGENVISYAGPSDISDALGRQLQPFENFPL